MTKRKNPRERIVQPFTEDDDQIFLDKYGTMPTKDLMPMMEYSHSLDSMYGHARLLGVNKRVSLWKEPEKRLLEKALELGMSYQQIVEASKQYGSIRNMTEAGITQYLYRVRSRSKKES